MYYVERRPCRQRGKKNAGGSGGGSPPAKPVKGGGLGGLCPPSQNSGGLGGSASQPKFFEQKIPRNFFHVIFLFA